MLDNGIQLTELPQLLHDWIFIGHVSVIYTNNVGPHRKLLPLLQRRWNDNVIIVTIDDDRPMAKSALLRLVTYYIDSGKSCIVGLRVRRIGMCMPTSAGYESMKAYFKKHKISQVNNGLIQNSRGHIIGPQMAPYGSCRWPRVQNSQQVFFCGVRSMISYCIFDLAWITSQSKLLFTC